MGLYRFESKILFFVHIPKTGGTSLEAVFREMGAKEALIHNKTYGYSKCTPQHMHADIYTNFVDSSFYDYAFAVCRHPVDRIVSEFRMRQKGLPVGTTFSEWLTTTLERYERNKYIYDNHIRPQVDFITENLDVFKLEDGLAQPIERVADLTGAPKPESVPTKRKSSRGNVRISDTDLEIIQNLYRRDFERFDYTITDSPALAHRHKSIAS